jgi:hypothetical protein
MIPAFKFARREGVRVYLDHMGHGVKRDLKVHTDLIFYLDGISLNPLELSNCTSAKRGALHGISY